MTVTLSLNTQPPFLTISFRIWSTSSNSGPYAMIFNLAKISVNLFFFLMVNCFPTKKKSTISQIAKASAKTINTHHFASPKTPYCMPSKKKGNAMNEKINPDK